MKFIVINGPNLNLLGSREPNIYGTTTLDGINDSVKEWAESNQIEIEFIQSNHEGVIVEAIQNAGRSADGIVINPAALTHYSVAVRDAISAITIPAVEVHLSNIHAREGFRAVSVTGHAAKGIVSGFGPSSYILGLEALKQIVEKQ